MISINQKFFGFPKVQVAKIILNFCYFSLKNIFYNTYILEKGIEKPGCHHHVEHDYYVLNMKFEED